MAISQDKAAARREGSVSVSMAQWHGGRNAPRHTRVSTLW